MERGQFGALAGGGGKHYHEDPFCGLAILRRKSSEYTGHTA